MLRRPVLASLLLIGLLAIWINATVYQATLAVIVARIDDGSAGPTSRPTDPEGYEDEYRSFGPG